MVRAIVTILIEGKSYGEIQAKAEAISVPGSAFEMGADNADTYTAEDIPRGTYREWLLY